MILDKKFSDLKLPWNYEHIIQFVLYDRLTFADRHRFVQLGKTSIRNCLSLGYENNNT